MKKAFFISLLIFISSISYASTQDFLDKHGFVYSNYSESERSIHIKELIIGGVPFEVVIVNLDKRTAINLTPRSEGMKGLINISTNNYAEFLSTLENMINVVKGSKQTDTNEYDDEIYCEDEEASDCVDGVVRTIAINDTWTVNPANLIKMLDKLHVSHIAISDFYIDSRLSIEYLFISSNSINLSDIENGLVNITIKNLIYHNNPDTGFFRSVYPDVGIEINKLELLSADLLSVYYAILEYPYLMSTVTSRGSWFNSYWDNIANYLYVAPITAKSVQAFDMTIIENGISIRGYTKKAHEKILRGEPLVNNDTQVFFTINANPASIKGERMETLFTKGPINAELTMKNLSNDNSTNRQSLKIKANDLFDLSIDYIKTHSVPRVVGEDIVFDAASFLKYFNSNCIRTGDTLYCKNLKIVQDKGFQTVNGAGDPGYAPRDVTKDRYKSIDLTYTDKGLNKIIIQQPKIAFNLKKVYYFMDNETIAKTDAFMMNPKSLKFKISSDNLFNQDGLNWKDFLKDKDIYLNINGEDVIGVEKKLK